VIALYIALGGALGSLIRHYAGTALAASLGQWLPWGTVLVNISGSFVIGCANGAMQVGAPAHDSSFVRYFVMVGICGGYTTFSAFSLQTFHMLQEGFFARAVLHAGMSVGACIIATALGYYFTQLLVR
jgi:fluoride exporter